MFRHHDVSVDDEAILATCFFQDIDEAISTFCCTQDGLASVAATGDEMQVLCTIVAMELSRHRITLAGMRDRDCDRVLSKLVMKRPHIAKDAMCGAPASILKIRHNNQNPRGENAHATQAKTRGQECPRHTSEFHSGKGISAFRKLELVFGSDVWECRKWSGVERRGLQEPRFLLGGEREGV
jgi:hypothetical protein